MGSYDVCDSVAPVHQYSTETEPSRQVTETEIGLKSARK